MKASVIIVTRNRAAELAATLEAIRHVTIPATLEVEFLVIDNGSTDGTREVVLEPAKSGPRFRYIREATCGQSNGRNRGILESQGDFIIFTDDDVRPPRGWLDAMCAPISSGMADATCGGVRLAPHLLRPWMTGTHRSWLASTEWITPGKPESMVGANMAFSRKVLEQVPRFDPELGPGALGFWDDTLFSRQLLAAGYRIADRMDSCVEHHFEASRMKRECWLNSAKRRGESRAYVGHHWDHWNIRMGWLRVRKACLKLAVWRKTHPYRMVSEGCDEEELSLVYEHAQLLWRMRQRTTPRKYDRCGMLEQLMPQKTGHAPACSSNS